MDTRIVKGRKGQHGDKVKIHDGAGKTITLTLEGFEDVVGYIVPINPSCEVIKTAIVHSQGRGFYVAYTMDGYGRRWTLTVSQAKENRKAFEARLKALGYEINKGSI